MIGGRCSRGRDWGYDADSIWVSGGCRAEFRYGYAGGTYPGGGNFAWLTRTNGLPSRGELNRSFTFATPSAVNRSAVVCFDTKFFKSSSDFGALPPF